MERISDLLVHIDSFEKHCMDIPFRRKGITNIEAYFIWAAIMDTQPDIVFESGICNGRSTDIIAKACEVAECAHVAVDTKIKPEVKKRHYSTVFIEDNSVNVSVEGRAVAFIDGPKQGRPFAQVMKNMRDAEIILVHDCYKGSVTRAEFIKRCKKMGRKYAVISPRDYKKVEHLNRDYKAWSKKPIKTEKRAALGVTWRSLKSFSETDEI